MAGPGQVDGVVPEVPGYRTLELLGEGGQGIVVLVERLGDGRKMAVKVLRAPSDATRRRFLREIALSRTFAHPNVVKVVDGSLAGDATGDPWFAMEYLEGESLAERLGSGPMGETEVVSVARQVADGLAYVHARGLVHRDVKPANIVIEDGGRAVLLDFGLVTGDDLTRLTRTREIPGTFVAMAPEQLDGRPSTPATDVYQLGVTLYAAVTGQAPFTVDDLVRGAATGRRGEPLPAERVSSCSAELSAVLQVCLREQPRDRYPTGEQLLADLERLERGESPVGYEAVVPVGDSGTFDAAAVPPRVPSHPPGDLSRARGPDPAHARRLLVGALGTLLVVVMVLVLAGSFRGPGAVLPTPLVPDREAESLLREILETAYGGVQGPDPASVLAVLRELDGLVLPGMEPALGGSLARQWRSAARALPEASPARPLVEASLLVREGSQVRATAAMAAALRAQRILLGARGEELAPAQLALDPLFLERILDAGRSVADSTLLRDVLDETDAFVACLPPDLAGGAAARRLRVLSLCGRAAGWSRGEPVEPSEASPGEKRLDAFEGLAVWAVRQSRAEREGLPPWCGEVLAAARSEADPLVLSRLGSGADLELADEAERAVDSTIKGLLRTSRNFAFVEGNLAAHVRSVVAAATRSLRGCYWRVAALAWCPGAPPETAALFSRVAARIAYTHRQVGVSEIQVATRLGEGFTPELLVGAAVAAVAQVLRRLPGLAGGDLAAPGAVDVLRRAVTFGISGRAAIDRLMRVAASRPLLGLVLQFHLRHEAGDAQGEAALVGPFLDLAWPLLEPAPPEAERSWPGARTLAEGLRLGWPRLVELGRSHEVGAAALRVARALEPFARPEPVDPGARILWRLAVVTAWNARLVAVSASSGAASAPDADDDGRWLRARVAALAAVVDPDDVWDLIKLAGELDRGIVVWE